VEEDGNEVVWEVDDDDEDEGIVEGEDDIDGDEDAKDEALFWFL
jgi:hypothetical protein